jgi:hypothetical protein
MSFHAKQSWSQRAVPAGLVTALLAFGTMPQPAAAQYVYDYGYIYARPAYYPRDRTQPTPRIHLTVSDTTEAAIGARAAIGRTALGAERTGAAVIGVTLGKVAGRIAAEQ